MVCTYIQRHTYESTLGYHFKSCPSGDTPNVALTMFRISLLYMACSLKHSPLLLSMWSSWRPLTSWLWSPRNWTLWRRWRRTDERRRRRWRTIHESGGGGRHGTGCHTFVVGIPPSESWLSLAKGTSNILERYEHFRAQCLWKIFHQLSKSFRICLISVRRICDSLLYFTWGTMRSNW